MPAVFHEKFQFVIDFQVPKKYKLREKRRCHSNTSCMHAVSKINSLEIRTQTTLAMHTYSNTMACKQPPPPSLPLLIFGHYLNSRRRLPQQLLLLLLLLLLFEVWSTVKKRVGGIGYFEMHLNLALIPFFGGLPFFPLFLNDCWKKGVRRCVCMIKYRIFSTNSKRNYLNGFARINSFGRK